ncbi:MAG: hypothetical protein CMJ58_19070 [Planctomycetaceae bacterium]|nr:hypothetical protein [Planctomycetaceae bacterium]
MSTMINSMTNRLTTTLAAAALLAATATTAPAAITGAGFTIDIASSARVLDAIGTPEYHDVLMDDSCDNPHLRIRANNKPAIMLTVNDTLSAGAELSSFALSIADPMYLFGSGDGGILENYTQFIQESIWTDDGVSIVSNTLSADGRTLTVDFDGLTAGKKVIFNVDLDVINDPSMFLYPDYRHVLHGAPMPGETELGDPATFLGVITDGVDSLDLDGTLTQLTETPTYSNQNIRPYQTMDMIPVTNTEVPGENIPEPSAIGLAGLAVLASYAVRRRRAG